MQQQQSISQAHAMLMMGEAGAAGIHQQPIPTVVAKYSYIAIIFAPWLFIDWTTLGERITTAEQPAIAAHNKCEGGRWGWACAGVLL